MKPYLMYKDRLTKASKTAPFKEALAAIEDYMAKKEAGIDVDKGLFDFAPAEEEEPVERIKVNRRV